jgi:hypothetical protein
MKEALRNARQRATTARGIEGSWSGYEFYDSGKASYDKTFAPMCEGGSPASQHIQERIARGKPAVACDLMATPQFLRDCKPTAGLAVGLMDKREKWRANLDTHTHIDALTGSILDGKTWAAIRKWVEVRSPDQAFHHIFSRAVGGLMSIPQGDTRVYDVFFNRIYDLLSADDGEALIQAPKESAEYLAAALPRIQAMPGVEANIHLPPPQPLDVENEPFTYPIFRLVKHANAPRTMARS